MMTARLVLLFVLFSIATFAQDNEPLYLNEFYQVGDSLLVGNEGPLRSTPSRSGKVIKKLAVGDKLYFIGLGDREAEKRETIFGLDGAFIPVHYVIDGEFVMGYVWDGLIARTYSYDKTGNGFLYSFESYDISSSVLAMKLSRKDAKSNAVYNQTIRDTINFDRSKVSKILPAMGLSQVDAIFRVGLLGEACGVSTNYHYYAWNGSSFIALPSKSSVGDAGIYSYSENLLFPSEHKYGKDLIVVESSEYESEYYLIEGIPDVEFVDDVEKKTIVVYKWTGKKYIKLNRVEEY